MNPRRTKPAYVYMARDKNGSIKVGCSVQPYVRMGQILELQGRPVLIGQFKVSDKAAAYRVEKAAHWLLREHFCRRQHFIKEWFVAPQDVVSECIKKAIRAERRALKAHDSYTGIRRSMKWWHVIAAIHRDKSIAWIKGEMTFAYIYP